MIQDIFPNRLDNQYVECSPQDNDVIFFFEGSSLLAKYIKEDTLTYPLYKHKDFRLVLACNIADATSK